MDKLRDFLRKRYDTSLDEINHYFGMDIYDLNEGEIIIDFLDSGNSDYFVEEGFYLAEASGRHALENAEISIRLKACDGLSIDFSDNLFYENTTILFNGEIIWKWTDGIESLSNVVVPKELILENDKNIISIKTSEKVLSPKRLGVSDDERVLAHRLIKIRISKLE